MTSFEMPMDFRVAHFEDHPSDLHDSATIMLILIHPLRRTLLQPSKHNSIRTLSTLPSNPHIYVFPHPQHPASHLLTLLPTTPPTPTLAIGTTTTLPPTPTTTIENPHFLTLLHATIGQHAHSDPSVLSQAAALASSSGFSLSNPRSSRSSSGGGGGASDQGGAGGGGRGGWVHVSDTRHPPDFGRIAEPEDIFGSVEVDSRGQLVDGSGRYQVSGTYRVVTREGVLGLGEYLRGRLVERLREEEEDIKKQKAA